MNYDGLFFHKEFLRFKEKEFDSFKFLDDL